MPYRCNSVDPIVNPIKPASIATVDDGGQFHTDCGGAGMAGSIRASIYADGTFACDRYSQCAV